MRCGWKLVTAGAWVLAMALAAPGEDVSALLEKGIYKEETAGDLAAAVQIYQQIIQTAEANQRFVAEAHVRLGLCQAKMGKGEQAAATLTKVITQYAEQSAVAHRARRELGRLVPAGMSPMVVETSPPAFAEDVSPDLAKLSVTFNRTMMDESWSWTYIDKGLYPRTEGKPQYDAARTSCSISVKLEPGKVYWVGINNEWSRHFQTPAHVSAKPYVILFATKGADGKPTPLPKELAERARAINAVSLPEAGAASAPAAEPLKLTPAGWKDGEVMRLAITSAAGADMGSIIYTARLVDPEGRPPAEAGAGSKKLWRIESFMVITAADMRQYTRVDAYDDGFAPLFGRTASSLMGDFSAVYRPGKIEWTAGGATRPALAVDRTLYDNEQALFLIRRLPLAKGYEATFPIFPVQSGVTGMAVRIAVEGQEKVAVPAGTFDCHKLKLQVLSGEAQLLQHTLWFSADENRYLVRYDSGSAVMSLAETSVRKPGQAARHADKDLGVTLALPPDWFAHRRPAQPDGMVQTDLVGPEADVWAIFIAKPRDKDFAGIRAFAEEDAKRVGRSFTNSAPPGSWQELKVSDLPAARCVADYKDRGKDWVEYRTYLAGQSTVYWFVFRMEKARLDERRKLCDAIVAGLKAQ